MTVETEADHDRVMGLPSIKRISGSDAQRDWIWHFQQRIRQRAEKKRAKAKAVYDAELRRISHWEDEAGSHSAALRAWSAEFDRRYWKLRRV